MRFALLSATACTFAAFLIAAAPSDVKKQVKKEPAKTAASAPSPSDLSFKTTGSASAQITLELYTDYQCPSCRVMFLETLPPLNTEYVNTGKVRLIHRDFPLPMHQFSKIAAKYANCAGTMGRYDLVATQLFKTQPEWSQNGNIDSVLARVLPPGEMQKLRAMVSDPKIDEGTAKDVAQGVKDNVMQTPTLEVVSSGKREQIGGNTPFPILKSYLDAKLKR